MTISKPNPDDLWNDKSWKKEFGIIIFKTILRFITIWREILSKQSKCVPLLPLICLITTLATIWTKLNLSSVSKWIRLRTAPMLLKNALFYTLLARMNWIKIFPFSTMEKIMWKSSRDQGEYDSSKLPLINNPVISCAW